MLNNLKKILLILTLSFCCSCSSNKKIEKDGLQKCQFSGNITHTQYWDQNDEWDLTGLKVDLYYSDNSTISIDAKSEYVLCEFYPTSPNGLSHDVSEFKILSATYIDYKGVKHDIPPITIQGIQIVDYPYKDNETVVLKKVLRDSIILLFVCGVFIVLFVCLYQKSKKQN